MRPEQVAECDRSPPLSMPASFCCQGAIDPRRRDYDSFFEAASHPAVLAEVGWHQPARMRAALLKESGQRCGADCEQ